MEDEKRTEEIKEIKREICNKYCKYAAEEDRFEILVGYCNKCPLNKID